MGEFDSVYAREVTSKEGEVIYPSVTAANPERPAAFMTQLWFIGKSQKCFQNVMCELNSQPHWNLVEHSFNTLKKEKEKL